MIAQFFSLILAVLISTQALAISKEMLAVVRYETKANAVATRSSSMISIQHYDIPMRLVSAAVADRISPKLLNSLVHTKNGEKYLRWMINPEDTKWHLQIAEFLTANGVSANKSFYFQGYQTASRSYILVDPISGAEFSAKVSTNKTGGNWKDKKQTYEDAKQLRLVNDYVADQVRKSGALKNVILLDEPAVFGIADLDQGLIIRDYGQLTGSGHYYVPGFSVMHDEVGAQLAQLNGSNDPAAYWNQHYNKPLARAIAEFAVLTGMSYDSPHSQNFMVELDSNQKPTGRIVMRDYGDAYVAKDFFQAVGRSDLPPQWEQTNVFGNWLPISSGIMHGNTAPSWISMVDDMEGADSYDRWGRDFFREFRSEYIRQTGIPLPDMGKSKRQGEYIKNSISYWDVSGLRLLELAKTDDQRLHLFKQNKCFALFSN